MKLIKSLLLVIFVVSCKEERSLKDEYLSVMDSEFKYLPVVSDSSEFYSKYENSIFKTDSCFEYHLMFEIGKRFQDCLKVSTLHGVTFKKEGKTVYFSKVIFDQNNHKIEMPEIVLSKNVTLDILKLKLPVAFQNLGKGASSNILLGFKHLYIEDNSDTTMLPNRNLVELSFKNDSLYKFEYV